MTDYPELLSKKNLSAFMGLPVKTALRLLEKHGIQPVDCGPIGRGKRLRWQRDAVKRVLDTLHVEAQNKPTSSVRRKPRVYKSVLGKSVEALYKELGGCSPTQ